MELAETMELSHLLKSKAYEERVPLVFFKRFFFRMGQPVFFMGRLVDNPPTEIMTVFDLRPLEKFKELEITFYNQLMGYQRFHPNVIRKNFVDEIKIVEKNKWKVIL